MSVVDQEIKKWVRFACEKNSVPELAKKITIEFNSRFTRRLGDARWDKRKKHGWVRLSGPLWPRASKTERYETVIHEVCHVVVGYLCQHRTAPHGVEWQQAMRNCGVVPKRTHSVDRTGLARRGVRHPVVSCPLAKKDRCTVGPKHFASLRAGGKLYCRKCRATLTAKSVKA